MTPKLSGFSFSSGLIGLLWEVLLLHIILAGVIHKTALSRELHPGWLLFLQGLSLGPHIIQYSIVAGTRRTRWYCQLLRSKPGTSNMSLTAHPTEKWKSQDQPSSEKGKTRVQLLMEMVACMNRSGRRCCSCLQTHCNRREERLPTLGA